MSDATRLKSLRTLVRLRERQGEALNQAVQAARGALSSAEEALAFARDEEQACDQALQEGVAEMEALTSAPFTPHALRALEFTIEDRKTALKQAGQAVQRQTEAVARQEQAVEDAQAAVRRNDQRLQGFREQVEQVLRDRAAREEEQAEEETEESSTARFVARVRAARALQTEADHG